MSNFIDYIKWRGDLSFAQSAFTEVDNLIFSQMSYVNFEGIVGEIGDSQGVTVGQAWEMYCEIHGEESYLNADSLTRRSVETLKEMADAPRFQGLRLYDYVNHIDEVEAKQFSAVRILVDEEINYIAFRGTDNTLVGWKEDFNMSFMSPIPAQEEAVKYLLRIAENLSGKEPQGYHKMIVGGHSKGGNLAVYSAAKMPERIQERIVGIYNNDGPGFDARMLKSPGYQAVLPRIRTIVPESSIVGMLLEHEEDYTVVKSSQTGRMQHDATSWEVLGNCFIHLKEVSRESRLLDKTIKSWIHTMDEEQLKAFVDTLFSVLTAADVKTVDDLSKEPLKNAKAMITAMRHMDAKTKKMLNRALNGFVKAGISVTTEQENRL